MFLLRNDRTEKDSNCYSTTIVNKHLRHNLSFGKVTVSIMLCIIPLSLSLSPLCIAQN